MSRIGKTPIKLPQGMKAYLEDARIVLAGPRGKVDLIIPSEVSVTITPEQIVVESNESNLRGLVKSLIANSVKGVTEGWSKTLELSGTGFRAATSGNQLQLNLGFSHQVTVVAPDGLVFEVKENKITVSGASKMLVGQLAAKIRQLKPADVYKAKGFKYEGESILRKPGKAAKAGGTAK